MAASSNSFAALDGLDMDTEEQALQSATDPYLKEKHAAALARGEKPLRDPIVWIDLEMTGLDLANDTIMEIAVIVTDGKLNTAIEVCVIGQYAHFSTLQLQMNAYCRIRASFLFFFLLPAQGPNITIHHTDEELSKMNAWCVKTHGKSGLTQR
jgi:oligoribonuclease